MARKTAFIEPSLSASSSTRPLGVTGLLRLGVLRGARRKSPVSSYGLADYEGVDVVSTLVGVDAFEIGHVYHHPIVEQDTVTPEDVT